MDVKQGYDSLDQKKGDNGLDLKSDGFQQTSDEYFCSRCDQNIRAEPKEQHEDWHLAQDLQAQEQDGATVSAAHPPPRAQQLDLKQAPSTGDKKGSQNQQPEFAPPSYPPPKHAVNNRPAAARPHTNQVIEAARVRARDEVHFAPPFRNSRNNN